MLFFALVWAVVWWWTAYEVLVKATGVSTEFEGLSPIHTCMDRDFVRYLGSAA